MKEHKKILEQIDDLKVKAKIGEEFVDIYESSESIKIEMKDENNADTGRCHQLMAENKELNERLVISEGLLKLREQELRLLKKPQKNVVVDIIDVNDK